MKKILIAICSVSLLMSCTSKEGKIQESITAKLKESMKDPESFEFVSMTIADTADVKTRKGIINKKKLDELKAMSIPQAEEMVKTYQIQYDFLQKQTDENKDAIYFVDFVAKGTNSFGAKIQNKYRATVLNDENATVASLSNND